MKMKFKIWRVTFLKSFLIIKKYWNGLPVFAQQTIYQVHSEMRQSLLESAAEREWPNYLTNPYLGYVARLGLELVAPGLKSDYKSDALDCANVPGLQEKDSIMVVQCNLKILSLRSQLFCIA